MRIYQLTTSKVFTFYLSWRNTTSENTPAGRDHDFEEHNWEKRNTWTSIQPTLEEGKNAAGPALGEYNNRPTTVGPALEEHNSRKDAAGPASEEQVGTRDTAGPAFEEQFRRTNTGGPAFEYWVIKASSWVILWGTRLKKCPSVL